MTNGLNWSKVLANINFKMTSFKKHIWPFINTRHRKKLYMKERFRRDICISHLKRSHISFTTRKTKSQRFPLTTTKTSFSWSQKTQSKNNKHFIRYVSLSTRKWNHGHGIIGNLLNCIVTPICQSAKLQRRQTLVL